MVFLDSRLLHVFKPIGHSPMTPMKNRTKPAKRILITYKKFGSYLIKTVFLCVYLEQPDQSQRRITATEWNPQLMSLQSRVFTEQNANRISKSRYWLAQIYSGEWEFLDPLTLREPKWPWKSGPREVEGEIIWKQIREKRLLIRVIESYRILEKPMVRKLGYCNCRVV